MNHDVQRTARLGVMPDRFEWTEEGVARRQAQKSTEQVALEMQGFIKPQKEPRPKPELQRPGKGRVFLGILLLFISSVSLPIIVPMFKASPTIGMLIVAVGLIVALVPFRARALALIPLTYVGYCFLTIKELTQVNLSPIFVVSAFVTAAVWGLILPFKKVRKYHKVVEPKRQVKKSRGVPIKDTYDFVYGRPGGVGGSVSTFGEAAVSAGVAGEESTAYLLETFLRGMPGVTIFHGLKFPGSGRADVDHAVVIGNRVILIDSKQYKSGTYEWYPTAEGEKIGTSYLDAKMNHMNAATEGYHKLLGSRSMKITSLLIIHGKDIKIGKRRWSPSHVGAFTAHEGLNYIGGEVRRMIPAEPDNYTKRVMLDNLKGAW